MEHQGEIAKQGVRNETIKGYLLAGAEDVILTERAALWGKVELFPLEGATNAAGVTFPPRNARDESPNTI